jgi:hypothetical protein
MTQKPDKARPCPICGGDVVIIVRGFPGPEHLELVQRGEAVLGGCEVEPGQPDGVCRDCGWPLAQRETGWRLVGDAPAS